MSHEWDEVSLARRGDTYTLSRLDSTGKFSEIKLSTANLLSIQPLIQRECAQLLENTLSPHSKEQGVELIVAIPVQGFVVGNDIHHQEIFLALQDSDGNRYQFSLEATESARRVGESLIQRANELAMARRTI
jgi:hypothetical protein